MLEPLLKVATAVLGACAISIDQRALHAPSKTRCCFFNQPSSSTCFARNAAAWGGARQGNPQGLYWFLPFSSSERAAAMA